MRFSKSSPQINLHSTNNASVAFFTSITLCAESYIRKSTCDFILESNIYFPTFFMLNVISLIKF